MKKEKKANFILRIIAFITGFIFIFLGGFDFLITTIPGVALVVWSLVGGEYRIIK